MSLYDDMCLVVKKFCNITNMPYNAYNKQYDKIGFYYDFKQHVDELDKFFNELVPQQGGKPAETHYTPKVNLKVHQLAYFNLGHGYPKELFGGHHCYIVKLFKTKVLVIPTTSVKKDSKALNSDYGIDIKVKGFSNDLVTRLQVSDIKCIDTQRLYLKKGIFDVETDKRYIFDEIDRIIFENNANTIDNTRSEEYTSSVI